ncbi:FHA domain-containing protein [Thermodesulfobacteriota bacterium]
MARLILTFNKQVINQCPFGKKGGITIGRKPANDIQIDNLAVSGHHARIDKAGSDYILTDLQSTNGTFVNDKKIVSHNLKHGDVIHIGKHSLVFVASDDQVLEETTLERSEEIEKTMILDTVRQREMLSHQDTPPLGSKMPGIMGVLSFIDNSDLGEIELEKKLTRIGKGDNCEVKLGGVMIGTTAATISKRPSGYTITFMGGMAKLKINGHIIKESYPLRDFDTIELGSYKFQFYQREPAGQEAENS